MNRKKQKRNRKHDVEKEVDIFNSIFKDPSWTKATRTVHLNEDLYFHLNADPFWGTTITSVTATTT